MRTRVLVLVVAVTLLASSGASSGELPLLVDAAKAGDVTRMQALLDNFARVDAAAVDGTTALHWASYRDDAAAARLLLRAGADVDVPTDLGVTPLWLACENGSLMMVEMLLGARADPNLRLLGGETPLMVGARSGHADVVAQLLASGADVDARGPRGQTALMWAAAAGHAEVVGALLAGGADPHVRSDVWSQVMAVPPHGRPEYNREVAHGGNTALMFAARLGDLASVRFLAAAGADVNETDASGVSATTLAAHAGHADLVAWLLARGADANVSAAGFTALHAAVMRRNEQMVSALLAHGADPNMLLRTWTPTRRSSRDWYFPPALVGASPLWLAARLGEAEIMRRLVRHGADPLFVHQADYVPSFRAPRQIETTTTLMAALGMGGGRTVRAWMPPDDRDAETRTLETVRLAVELGVDVNAAGAGGRTALDAAKALEYTSVVDFLIERGARPDAAVAVLPEGGVR